VHVHSNPTSSTLVDAQALTRNGDRALANGLRKRAAGVPTYSVPEAAALLSVSREHLYRLIRAGVFPAMRMGLGAGHGRYVVPARAVEAIIDAVVPIPVAETDGASVNVSAGGVR
jgi:excisionase family DNA binding protein